MKIIPLSLKFLTSRNITTKEIRSNVDELAVEPNIDRWYMIETDGLEHDLDHLKFNLNNLENDENLHSGIIKIGNENI